MGEKTPGQCDRCGGALGAHTTSYFNTDVICMGCKEHEQAHPRYGEAVAAETAACRSGDMNYAGIGLPAKLRR